MANSKPTIKVTKEIETAARTVWLVEYVYPPMSGKWGKTYRATVYPNSDLLYLQTATKRLRVAAGVASVIGPQIRAALINAGVVFVAKSPDVSEPVSAPDIGAADDRAQNP